MDGVYWHYLSCHMVQFDIEILVNMCTSSIPVTRCKILHYKEIPPILVKSLSKSWGYPVSITTSDPKCTRPTRHQRVETRAAVSVPVSHSLVCCRSHHATHRFSQDQIARDRTVATAPPLAVELYQGHTDCRRCLSSRLQPTSVLLSFRN